MFVSSKLLSELLQITIVGVRNRYIIHNIQNVSQIFIELRDFIRLILKYFSGTFLFSGGIFPRILSISRTHTDRLNTAIEPLLRKNKADANTRITECWWIQVSQATLYLNLNRKQLDGS